MTGGCVRDERASLRWPVEATANKTPCGEQGLRIMAKYCVPILAIRHGYVVVEAASEHDALVKGWDSSQSQSPISGCIETVSVEKPFRPSHAGGFGLAGPPAEDPGQSTYQLINAKTMSRNFFTQKNSPTATDGRAMKEISSSGIFLTSQRSAACVVRQ